MNQATFRSKRTLFVAGLALVATLGLGCPSSVPTDNGTNDVTLTGDDSVAPTGSQLLALITGNNDFEQWAQFPGQEGVISSTTPHGPMARVFINDVMLQALDVDFLDEAPNGSIIVKDSFSDDTNAATDELTVMWKVNGFDSNNNDWFWADFTRDGDIRSEGRIQSCIKCHSDVQNNDFIFLYQF